MIVVQLPAPISVNRSRRIDWRNHGLVKDWLRQADALFLTQKRGLPPPILGQYEIILTLRDGSRLDADNCAKLAIDVLRRYQLVTDDSPKFMRRVTIEFGNVAGCQITIKPWKSA